MRMASTHSDGYVVKMDGQELKSLTLQNLALLFMMACGVAIVCITITELTNNFIVKPQHQQHQQI